MSFKKLIGLMLAVVLLAAACKEERPAEPAHAPRADGQCCEFHAKKAVVEPKRVELGKGKAGAVELTAAHVGEIKAGEPLLLQVKTREPLAEGDKVRAWIGTEQAARKTSAEYCEVHEEWDVEVDVPKTITPDMKAWIEVVPKAGTAAATSFALKL
jgi:hypothetical protein